MKKIITLSLMVSFLVTCFAFTLKAQVSDQIKFIFVKEKGKIVKLNDQNQKVIEYTISGLASPTDLEKIQNHFRSSKLVIAFNISNEVINGVRKAKLVGQKEYKRADFIQSLKTLGIKEIIVDSKTIAVSDIESVKKVNKKAAGR